MAGGWNQRLQEARLSLLHELPRMSWQDEAHRGRSDHGREQRVAALVSAYHTAPDGVVLGWHRAQPDGPIDVVVGGSALVGPAGASPDVVLTYPPGARARLVPGAQLLEAWRGFPCWMRLTGVPDVLALSARPGEEILLPSLEDSLLGAWRHPFCWLALALPVPGPEVTDHTREASRLLRLARSQASSSQDQAVEAERLEARHRELRQAESTGLWHIHLLAGGHSEAAARGLAGLLAASADLSEVPYVLAPQGQPVSLDTALDQPVDGAPFTGSSHLLARLARPPAEEVPGIRLALRPEFDVTPEAEDGCRPRLALGDVLDRNGFPAGPLHLTLPSLNRHTFVCGATGAGKSQTVRSLLEELAEAGIPWMVVEPAKAEYRLMGARRPGSGIIAIRPGDPEGIPAGINPLEPELGFPLQTHADLVRALFLAAFEADEPFPQVLSTALTRCYEELGWDLTVSEPLHPTHLSRYPSLADLQRVARQVVEQIGYGQEVTQNVRGFIEVRLSSLRLGTTGRFFEGGHPIDFGRLLARNVVLEIEDVGDDRDKAFLMGTVLVRLVEHLRVLNRRRPPAEVAGLRHVSVFEEAHRLLRRPDTSGPAAHAVELFAGLLAEIRAYGEGLVVAEQIPGKLVPDVIKNTAVKIVHRLPAQDDRDAVGATMNVTPAQSDYLVTLRPGTAAVFADGMDFPVLVRMPDRTASEMSRAQVAPATALVRSCSVACGPECRERPCTLREMRLAERLLDEPRLVAWVETALVSHLTGIPTPAPGPLGDEVGALLSTRQRDCAIRLAVTASVDARRSALAQSMDPILLTEHMAVTLRAQLDGAPPCLSPEPAWQAIPYQWHPVLSALRRRVREGRGSARHPFSQGWEHLYGCHLPGANAREQLAAVTSWSLAERPSAGTRLELLLGRTRPSPLERAMGMQVGDDGWESALTRLLDRLDGESSWLVRLLALQLEDSD